jgi:hypothetical protein
MGAWPRAAGTVASAKMQQATGEARPVAITGMNTPALLCATSTAGSPGSSPASPALTAATTPGQNGGSLSATPSSDGTAVR